jgi:hypothetical protein
MEMTGEMVCETTLAGGERRGEVLRVGSMTKAAKRANASKKSAFGDREGLVMVGYLARFGIRRRLGEWEKVGLSWIGRGEAGQGGK